MTTKVRVRIKIDGTLYTARELAAIIAVWAVLWGVCAVLPLLGGVEWYEVVATLAAMMVSALNVGKYKGLYDVVRRVERDEEARIRSKSND